MCNPTSGYIPPGFPPHLVRISWLNSTNIRYAIAYNIVMENYLEQKMFPFSL